MVQYRHPTPRSTWGVQWFAVAMVQWSPLGLAVGPTCVSVNLSVMGLQGWEGLCGEVGLMSWDKHFQLVLLGSLLVIMVVGHETFMEPPVGLLTTGSLHFSGGFFIFSRSCSINRLSDEMNLYTMTHWQFFLFVSGSKRLNGDQFWVGLKGVS